VKAFRAVTSRALVLDRPDVDTDQIIPKQFLKRIERTGFGEFLFFDWRKDPAFELNQPEAQGARILITGRNFGCGSSREHAVWALQGAGFDVVVSSQFADIFRANAIGNGLLPVEVSKRMLVRLMDVASSSDMAVLAVDLETQTLQLPDGDTVKFPIAPFAKHCLLNGIGEMDFLLGATGEIAAFENGRPKLGPSAPGPA
jgi:3-isopropylmalate/(R)-2-methylmalate dehydratase small subunit